MASLSSTAGTIPTSFRFIASLMTLSARLCSIACVLFSIRLSFAWIRRLCRPFSSLLSSLFLWMLSAAVWFTMAGLTWSRGPEELVMECSGFWGQLPGSLINIDKRTCLESLTQVAWSLVLQLYPLRSCKVWARFEKWSIVRGSCISTLANVILWETLSFQEIPHTTWSRPAVQPHPCRQISAPPDTVPPRDSQNSTYQFQTHTARPVWPQAHDKTLTECTRN